MAGYETLETEYRQGENGNRLNRRLLAVRWRTQNPSQIFTLCSGEPEAERRLRLGAAYGRRLCSLACANEVSWHDCVTVATASQPRFHEA